MSEVMETQMTKSFFGDDIMESACYIIRRDQSAEIVTTDETLELLIIGLSAYLFEMCFKLSLFKEHSLNVRYQWKCSSCGIGFQPVLNKELSVTVLIVAAHDLSLNYDRLVLKVDSIPLQTK